MELQRPRPVRRSSTTGSSPAAPWQRAGISSAPGTGRSNAGQLERAPPRRRPAVRGAAHAGAADPRRRAGGRAGRDGVAPLGGPALGHAAARRRGRSTCCCPTRTRQATVDGRGRPSAARPARPDPEPREHVPVTNILRTLCDLGALDAAAVPGAVGHVVSTALASPAALRAADPPPRSPWPSRRAGAPRRARRLGARRQAGRQRPRAGDAPAARATRPAAGRVPPVLGGYEVDFLVDRQPARPRVRRVDHARARPGPVRARSERDADLAALGFVVLRFTYRDITKRPEQDGRSGSAATWSAGRPTSSPADPIWVQTCRRRHEARPARRWRGSPPRSAALRRAGVLRAGRAAPAT